MNCFTRKTNCFTCRRQSGQNIPCTCKTNRFTRKTTHFTRKTKKLLYFDILFYAQIQLFYA